MEYLALERHNFVVNLRKIIGKGTFVPICHASVVAVEVAIVYSDPAYPRVNGARPVLVYPSVLKKVQMRM